MIDSSDRNRLAENWAAVVSDVAEAARRAGRSASEVRIVGVSKYVDVDLTAALVDVGCKELGENRPQQLWRKAEAIQDTDVTWHLIGHLQRNKIQRTLERSVWIHSIDSERLLNAVSEQVSAGVEADRRVPVLFEINVSGEEAKTGMSGEEIRHLMSLLPLPGIDVRGIMAMAGWGTSPDESRRQFAAAREFRDTIERDFGVSLPELSMGMSGDYAEAIAEGATLVRIGSRLFEGLLSS